MNNILDFFVAPGNIAFLVAGCVVLAVLLIELMATFIGFSLHMFDADVDIPLSKGAEMDGFLGWLNPGNVPVILLLTMFLGCLSLVGFVGNWVWTGLGFNILSPLFTTPIVGATVLPIVSKFSAIMGHMLHQEDSNAVTLDDMLGYYGVVTLGPVQDRVAGQARFRDDHGISHYVDVVAETGQTIDIGDDVVLLQRLAEGSFMFVIRKV